jgi:deoxyhypusine synthase
MEEVKDMELKEKETADSIIKQMKDAGGFVCKKIGLGVDILEDMQKDKDCTKFLSFPACIIATGMRGIIKDLVKEKRFDVLITTCGTLDHDISRIFKPYLHGDFAMDDVAVYKKGFHRLGNVLIKIKDHGPVVEDFMKPLLERIYKEKKIVSTRELVWAIGEEISKQKNCEESICYWAWKNKIPVFIPAPTDGAVGSQLWLFSQNHDFIVDVLKDEREISQIILQAKKAGALLLGGGVSKHHTIWWNQFRGGLDYAVQISTAVEWDGSLSGAQTREAITWGKLKEKAKHITIEADVTSILPLMIGALRERTD